MDAVEQDGGEAGPLDDLAGLAALVAGGSACIRDAEGTCLGRAGVLDLEALALSGTREVLVPDASLDPTLAAHPMVRGAPYLRLLVRIPARDGSGAVVGFVEVADTFARLLPDAYVDALRAVARRVADALRPAPPAWRAVVDALPLPVFLLAVGRGRAVFMGGNAAARRMMLQPESALSGRDLDETFPWARENDVTERALRVAETREPEAFELQTSETRAYVVRLFPLPDGYVGGLVDDVSERLGFERRRAEFLAEMSHQLRTPVSAVRGAIGLLEGGVAGPLPEGAARLVGIAREGIERLGRVVNDLLDLERLRAGLLPLRSDPVDVAGLISLASGAVAGQARASAVTVRVVEDATGSVLGDRERLAQALTNLLSNAVRRSPSGDSVDVHVARSRPDRVRVSVRHGGRRLDPTELDLLFDPTQAGARGAFGLAITRFVAEGHGGTVGARSEGAGASYWMELPLLTAGP